VFCGAQPRVHGGPEPDPPSSPLPLGPGALQHCLYMAFHGLTSLARGSPHDGGEDRLVFLDRKRGVGHPGVAEEPETVKVGAKTIKGLVQEMVAGMAGDEFVEAASAFRKARNSW